VAVGANTTTPEATDRQMGHQTMRTRTLISYHRAKLLGEDIFEQFASLVQPGLLGAF